MRLIEALRLSYLFSLATVARFWGGGAVAVRIISFALCGRARLRLRYLEVGAGARTEILKQLCLVQGRC